jgi:hypothetical protein
MAVVTYRLRRLARIEVGYFDVRLRFDALPPRYNADGKLDPVAWAFHLDCQLGDGLHKLARYKSHLQREFTRCLNDLEKLRKLRRAQPAEEVPPPEEEEPYETNPRGWQSYVNPATYMGSPDLSDLPGPDASPGQPPGDAGPDDLNI